jgi:hypothetical protein
MKSDSTIDNIPKSVGRSVTPLGCPMLGGIRIGILCTTVHNFCKTLICWSLGFIPDPLSFLNDTLQYNTFRDQLATTAYGSRTKSWTQENSTLLLRLVTSVLCAKANFQANFATFFFQSHRDLVFQSIINLLGSNYIEYGTRMDSIQ